MDAVYRWDRGLACLKPYDGKRMTIVRPLVVGQECDEEVGPMFLARFDDGFQVSVFADEIGGERL